MTCDEARDLLLERPAGDAGLRDHLGGCRDCAVAQEEMARIDAWVAPLRSAPVPPTLFARPARRPSALLRLVPLAAAAAMLFTISLIVAFWKQPAPAQNPPVGGLLLSVTLDKERYEFKEPLSFTATFENAGDKDVVFHKGESTELLGFPAFRISGAGRDWRFHIAPFQTMVSSGMIGSLETLKPGERRSYAVKVHLFEKAGSGSPENLPEGDYRVSAVYEKKDNLVGFNVGGFNSEFHPVAGLWTGTLSSPEKPFHVGASQELLCGIAAAHDGTRVLVEIRNPLPSPLRVTGPATISVNSKEFGGGSAVVPIKEELKLAPGESRSLPVDLSELSWTPSDPKKKEACGISDFAPTGGWMSCALDYEGPGKEVRKAAAPGRLIPWAPDVSAPAGLSLSLTVQAPTTAIVSLKNTGSAPAIVNKRLRYASDLAFTLTDSKGVKGAVCSTTGTAPTEFRAPAWTGMSVMSPPIVDPLSWSRDAFPKPSPLVPEDFATLAPGASVEATIDLGTIVHGGLPAGSYQVRAIYLNLESGVRMGLRPALRGKLTSNSVPVDLR